MKFGHRPFPILPARIARLFRRLLKAQDGVETIEFALAAVTLFLFLLGVVEFGRLYWTQSELQYAAEAAARCVTVNCCNGGPAECGGSTGTTGYQNYAAGQLLGVSLAGSDLTNFQVTNPAPPCGNQVTFQYDFDFIVVGSLFGQNTITLSMTACNQG